MKIIWFILFIHQMKNLLYDVLLISHAISILNILTDSFSVRQGVTIKKALLQVLLKTL